MKKGLFSSVAILASLALAPAAFAGDAAVEPPTASVGACGEPFFEQTFLPWGDKHLYSLAPGGDFENGAPGWLMNAGAGLFPEGGDTALWISPGSTAVSPPICVAEGYTHARMFGLSGSTDEDKARLRVDVYHGTNLVDDPAAAKKVKADDSWDATRRFTLEENGFELAPGTATGTIHLIFNGIGKDPYLVDDVYIDPSRRN